MPYHHKSTRFIQNQKSNVAGLEWTLQRSTSGSDGIRCFCGGMALHTTSSRKTAQDLLSNAPQLMHVPLNPKTLNPETLNPEKPEPTWPQFLLSRCGS